MASGEREPFQVSASASSEHLRNGENSPELEDQLDEELVLGRRNFAHAGRVLSRMENGHNTTLVRHVATVMLQKGVLPQGSHLEERIIGDLTATWRRQGSIPDDQLDTTYSPPQNSRKRDKGRLIF